MNHTLRALSLILSASLVASASAQTINRFIPEAAAPNDILIIEGTNLGAASQVDFIATVGGFVGILTRSVAPLAVDPAGTRVIVQVPRINAFTPPNATPPGDPLGRVRIQTSNGRTSNDPTWYYMEATFGAITTMGQGTTQPGGMGRPVVGFTLAGGAPALGNMSFTPTLGNAQPGTLALFALGRPATPPFQLIGDGIVVTNPVIGTVITGFVSATGDAQILLPVPSTPFGITFMVQWAALSPGGIFVSNGLQFDL